MDHTQGIHFRGNDGYDEADACAKNCPIAICRGRSQGAIIEYDGHPRIRNQRQETRNCELACMNEYSIAMARWIADRHRLGPIIHVEVDHASAAAATVDEHGASLNKIVVSGAVEDESS